MKTIRYILFGIVCVVSVWLCIDGINHIIAEVNHRNGYIQKERGYPKIANRSYKKAVDLMPWENHYRLQLAKSYEDSAKRFPNQHQRFTNLAIKEYETLIKRDSMNPWFKARLGLLYHDLHERFPEKTIYKQLASDLAESAMLTDPKNPLFTLHYAHFLYNSKNINEAKKFYKKSIEYDKGLTDAHFNLGAIYLNENNNEKGIDHLIFVTEQLKGLEQQLKNNPSNEVKTKVERYQNARINVAKYYLNKNKVQDAYELINQIPVSVEKFELLAFYYERINQPTTAISVYTQLNQRLNTTKYSEKIQKLKNIQ